MGVPFLSSPPTQGLFVSPGSIPRIEMMAPPSDRLIDLFTAHYLAFERTQPLQEHVRRAVRMAIVCHTAILGGHVERCPNGHIERIFYNSCGHRCCPRCAPRMRRTWLLNRQAKLLPVRHYHVVLTLPHTFNALWHWHPRVMGDLLFHSATGALRALLADPQWLGAEPGLTVTLETWDDRLQFHPHLHCLVTGGGMTPDGAWVEVPNPRCLVAVKPLMWEFRKRFCQGLRQALEDEALTIPPGMTACQWRNRLNQAHRLRWEVFIAKPPEDGGPTPDQILRYQAEDVAGGPLAGDRLVSSHSDLTVPQLAYLTSSPLNATRIEDAPPGTVSFRWGDYDPATGTRPRDQIETLPVEEFFRRYLQHVPPTGYQAARHYGLYTSAKRDVYQQARALLADRQPPSVPEARPDDDPSESLSAWRQEHTCPWCGEPLIVTVVLPSSQTGRVSVRVPIGQPVARAPDSGGTHAP